MTSAAFPDAFPPIPPPSPSTVHIALDDVVLPTTISAQGVEWYIRARVLGQSPAEVAADTGEPEADIRRGVAQVATIVAQHTSLRPRIAANAFDLEAHVILFDQRTGRECGAVCVVRDETAWCEFPADPGAGLIRFGPEQSFANALWTLLAARYAGQEDQR